MGGTGWPCHDVRVSSSLKDVAARALQCLADRIYSPRNEVPASDLTIPHRLVVRGSSAPRAGTP